MDLLERMKHGRGIKDRDDTSMGMEILVAEAFAKINPTEPLILTGISLDRADASRCACRNNKRRKSS